MFYSRAANNAALISNDKSIKYFLVIGFLVVGF